MNDYDDLDDYSSGNSFRARSNTWPLNRPDFAVPSSGANIDETLPEIELEDDDLFTTNENWTTGMVDHDIMSWDPILNAQNQQQQQQALNNQPSTVHHHHQQQPPPQPTSQQQQTSHHQAQATQPQIHAQHTSHQLTQLVPSSSLQQTTSEQTRQQQSIHHIQNHIHHQPSQQHQHNHRHQQSQDPTHHLHQHQQHRSDQQQPQLIHHTQQQQHHHHQQQHPHTQHHHHHQQQPQQQQQHHQTVSQRNDTFLDGVSLSSVIVSTQDTAAQLQAPNQQTQLPHQTSPQPSHHQHVQHQTLNSVVHCLEHEDVNEYNLQLQHLHLDNNPLPPLNDTSPQDHPFAPTLTSLCVHNTTTSAAAAAAAAAAANIRSDNYNISPDPSHHDLQPLTSARFDLDPTNNIVDYDLKEPLGGLPDPLDQHHHLLTQQQQQQPHLHDQQLIHHQLPLEHQIHTSHHTGGGGGLTSSSLDNHSTAGSNVLSSSLGTSGIGLSGDLEDLDYKHNVDSVNFLQSSHSDEQPRLQVSQQQQQSEIHQQSSDNVIANDTKQRSNSTSTPKAAKQNVPRRNAWGNLSYADLISQAINSTSDKRLTLSQIYDWMVQHVPYFKDKGDSNSSAGWKNSVRHNLSLHSRFKRLQNEGTGKSSWWTINPEANVGKCARRRAASMEASKYEKKRGRAKKKAEAIRAGLVSYPSLTNSSLNGSTSTLEQQPSQAQSISQFHTSMGPVAAGSSSGLQQSEAQEAQQQQQQIQPSLEQFASAQELTSQQQHRPEMQFQTLDQYGTDRPSQHQQQQLQQLQQSDARSCEELDAIQSSIEQNHFSVMQQQQQLHNLHHHHHQQQMPAQLQHHLEQAHSEESNKNSKIQQQQQQQQSQYYYQFELSTAL